MGGHRPFRDLTERWPAARKARLADKAAALSAAAMPHETAQTLVEGTDPEAAGPVERK